MGSGTRAADPLNEMWDAIRQKQAGDELQHKDYQGMLNMWVRFHLPP